MGAGVATSPFCEAFQILSPIEIRVSQQVNRAFLSPRKEIEIGQLVRMRGQELSRTEHGSEQNDGCKGCASTNRAHDEDGRNDDQRREDGKDVPDADVHFGRECRREKGRRRKHQRPPLPTVDRRARDAAAKQRESGENRQDEDCRQLQRQSDGEVVPSTTRRQLSQKIGLFVECRRVRPDEPDRIALRKQPVAFRKHGGIHDERILVDAAQFALVLEELQRAIDRHELPGGRGSKPESVGSPQGDPRRDRDDQKLCCDSTQQCSTRSRCRSLPRLQEWASDDQDRHEQRQDERRELARQCEAQEDSGREGAQVPPPSLRA